MNKTNTIISLLKHAKTSNDIIVLTYCHETAAKKIDTLTHAEKLELQRTVRNWDLDSPRNLWYDYSAQQWIT